MIKETYFRSVRKQNSDSLIGLTRSQCENIVRDQWGLLNYRIDSHGGVYDGKHFPTDYHILLNADGLVSEIRDNRRIK